MVCIKADRGRGRRESFNPSAPGNPDSAFIAARVGLYAMAGIGVVSAFQFLAVVADAEWSDDELTSAISQATEKVDSTSRFGAVSSSNSCGSSRP